MLCSGKNSYRCEYGCCHIWPPSKAGNKSKERRLIKKREKQELRMEFRNYM